MFTLLGMSGSLRQASTNRGLLRCAQIFCQAEEAGRYQFNILDLIDIPFFNGDLEAEGPPPSVQNLMEAVHEADALVLACPEYNYSMAPALKNALDWASRAPENAALTEKPVIFFGAGGGMGTSRSQYHLRQVCVRLDLHPQNKPEGFFNAFQGGFDAAGNVTDPEIVSQVGKMMRGLFRVLESRTSSQL